mmetsp:Transcript_40744/g.123033  ORF Transcript_40744/g.123033 Transcript_40744/m.123033 type:complete len:203 (-) Transcript_40744:898-1506(-)
MEYILLKYTDRHTAKPATPMTRMWSTSPYRERHHMWSVIEDRPSLIRPFGKSSVAAWLSPMYAMVPWWAYLKGAASLSASRSCWPARNMRPRYLPCCAATCAVGGLPLTAQSPSAKTSPGFVPLTRKHSSTSRPRRSVWPLSGPIFWHSAFVKGRMPTPATQTRVPNAIVSIDPSFILMCTLSASASLTIALRRTSTPWPTK